MPSADAPSLFANVEAPTAPGERRLLDRYYTAQVVADACVSVLPRMCLPAMGRALEPHAGGGAFLRAISARMPRMWANDADPSAVGLGLVREDRRRVGDFLLWDPADAPGFDFIGGNPPYDGAVDQVEHSIAHLHDGGSCAFLLRLGFLASLKRSEFFRRHRPRAVWVLDRRPSFTGGGTDKYDYAFIHWTKGWTGATRMDWLRWGAK